MLWFTEISTSNGPQPIVFQFFVDELPENISFGKTTKLNKLEYFGGFKTNQIIGTFQKEVEWSGVFSGTKTLPGNKQVSAKVRYDALESLMGRPLRVGFPSAGMAGGPFPGEGEYPEGLTDADFVGGIKGVYVIEELTPTIENYWHVEYKIRLVPHQRQEKIRPTETRQVLPEPKPEVIQQTNQRVDGRRRPTTGATRGQSSRVVDRPTRPNPPGNRPASTPPRELGGFPGADSLR